MTRDEYREEAILWLHRQREYLKLANEVSGTKLSEEWFNKAENARTKVQFCASLAGLESIEELEE